MPAKDSCLASGCILADEPETIERSLTQRNKNGTTSQKKKKEKNAARTRGCRSVPRTEIGPRKIRDRAIVVLNNNNNNKKESYVVLTLTLHIDNSFILSRMVLRMCRLFFSFCCRRLYENKVGCNSISLVPSIPSSIVQAPVCWFPVNSQNE